jgi:hypothetical protein
MTELKLTTPVRSAGFVFILITVLLDMLALGIIIPVLPKLVVDFVRRRRPRRRLPRAVRHRLGPDAIRVLADTRRPVRPLWSKAADPVLEFRARP